MDNFKEWLLDNAVKSFGRTNTDTRHEADAQGQDSRKREGHTTASIGDGAVGRSPYTCPVLFALTYVALALRRRRSVVVARGRGWPADPCAVSTISLQVVFHKASSTTRGFVIELAGDDLLLHLTENLYVHHKPLRRCQSK